MSTHKAHADSFTLDDKVVLITGAARGLGFGYATAAAAAGAHVVLNDRDTAALAVSFKKLTEAGYSCSVSPFDVTVEADVRRGISAILDERDHIDVLVNNAGNQLRKPFVDYTLEEWQSIMNVHVNGSFLVSQSVARHMLERRSGCIVMIGSIVVESIRGTISPYVTAKGATTALGKALAAELGPSGIRCNIIAPGMFETDFTRDLVNNPTIHDALAKKIPLRRWGKPADIGPLIVYLASDAGRYVNGQIFTIDGGILAAL
jgi:gluconate 5-dehydrogenase